MTAASKSSIGTYARLAAGIVVTAVCALPLPTIALTDDGAETAEGPVKRLSRSALRMQRASAAIEAGEFSFARTLIGPVLIHPRLSRDPEHNAAFRGHAYFLQGFTFHNEGLYRSAAIAYANSLDFDPKNLQALNALAFLHATGKGVAMDTRTAHDLYLRAGEQGHLEALTNAGLLFLSDDGQGRDLGEARRLLDQAASQGHRRALLPAGRAWRDQDDNYPSNPARAQELFQEAANQGFAPGAMALGFMLRSNELGEPDLTLARAQFQIAAEAGEAPAQAALAFMFLTGDGGEENPERARYWYQRSADGGDAEGAFGFAYALDAGVGGEQDRAAARQWYEQAAEGGSTNAQLRLGERHYARGELDAARNWLTRAADGGNVSAQNSLAWLLATSRDDATRDGEIAVKWASKAVEANPTAAHIDTLAAAYAEAGQFDQAADAQARALEVLTATEQALRPEFEQRLARYQTGVPWREPGRS